MLFPQFTFNRILPFSLVLFLVGAVFVRSGFAESARKSVPGPDNKHLFEEDKRASKRNKSARVQAIIKSDKVEGDELNLNAPQVDFDKDKNLVNASGGIILSRAGVQAQADQAKVDMTNKIADLNGSVVIAHEQGGIAAESGNFNFETETGDFNSSDLTIEEGSYDISAEKCYKLSETEYQLLGSVMTTCHCQGGEQPWTINTSRAHITQEGYAHTYNTTLRLGGLPVFYSPYFAFPVKQERSSGLLVPEYGLSDRNGVGLKLPFFLVVDDSTDVTLSPFIQTKTRRGSELDFRKSFSRYNNISAGLLYSDESERGDSLRGTDTSGIYDPTFDQDRFGAFYKHIWRSSPDADWSPSFIGDVHYISDDLFLRELQIDEIGEKQDIFTTSRGVFRSNIGEYVLAELAAEYNQSIISNDDLVLQRLPDFTLTGSKSFRPFGYNPYGLKVLPSTKLQITSFDRDLGYDGLRTDLFPSVTVPFHYQNYFESKLNIGLHHTMYDLDDRQVPGSDTLLDSSSDRDVFQFGYSASTGLERIYDLEPENWFTKLAALGVDNQASRLTRLKHTIEPAIGYTYVPDTSQADLPLFDSLDRIRERSLISYGFRTSLFGRFDPLKSAATGAIEELTPKVEDLPLFQGDGALADVGGDLGSDASAGYVPSRRTDIRELAELVVKQSYDYKEDVEDNDPQRNAFSDVGMRATFFPNESFALGIDSNLDAEKHDFSSWGLAAYFKDDRGDTLAGRFSYIENGLSQLENSLQVALSERLKIGYYTRYDEQQSEFIENRIALRLYSQCDCWHADLGLSEETNPDDKNILLRFTFSGLGDVVQNIGLSSKSE